MILNSPLPFPYVHLVSLLVHFSALFACLKCGVTLGTESKTPGPVLVVFELLFVLAMNSLYSGLLCFTVALTNPFLDEIIDFPAASFHHRLWKKQHWGRDLLHEMSGIDK